jgi:hypothetical protein
MDNSLGKTQGVVSAEQSIQGPGSSAGGEEPDCPAKGALASHSPKSPGWTAGKKAHVRRTTRIAQVAQRLDRVGEVKRPPASITPHLPKPSPASKPPRPPCSACSRLSQTLPAPNAICRSATTGSAPLLQSFSSFAPTSVGILVILRRIFVGTNKNIPHFFWAFD